MRLARLALAACLLPPAAALPARAAPFNDAAPVGRWLTEGRDAVIAIEACGDALCGRIVGIPLDGPQDPIPTDHQGRSQCGLGIIQGAVPGEDGTWSATVTARDGITVVLVRVAFDATWPEWDDRPVTSSLGFTLQNIEMADQGFRG